MSSKQESLKYPSQGDDTQDLRRWVRVPLVALVMVMAVAIAGSAGDSFSIANDPQDETAVGEALPEVRSAPRPALDAPMLAALDYVAQRYRVSPKALKPIFAAARESAKGLDPLLIIAVIGIESGFNPLAQSVMGAQGLMQVIPRYHREKLPPDTGEAALLDPVANVKVGSLVLHEAIRRQGGLIEGLQYYAGAADDPERGYSAKVIAEKTRLEHAIRARKLTLAMAPEATKGHPDAQPKTN